MAGWLLVKVALLSDCFLPRLGGIEVQTDGLARALVAAGHEVEVFTATAGPEGEHDGMVVDHGGFLVHHFSTPLTFGIPVNPLATGRIRRLLGTRGFAVAHGQMGVVSPFATSTIGAALDVGLPTAATWHSVLDSTRPLFRALGQARRWARRGAALSAVSSMAARQVQDIADQWVGILPNGIDVARWAPGPGDAGQSAGEPLVVASAIRLARRKRPEAVLDIAAEVRARLGDGRVHFDVFGDGRARDELQARLDRSGLAGTVSLRGRVTREELRAAYTSSGAYLSTARLEAFGIAPLEARTAGLPIVALRGTGVDDFVRDDVEGLLAEGDSGLVEAIVRLAIEPALRQRIAEHNRDVPPVMDWGHVVDRALAEYERAGARVGA